MTCLCPSAIITASLFVLIKITLDIWISFSIDVQEISAKEGLKYIAPGFIDYHLSEHLSLELALYLTSCADSQFRTQAAVKTLKVNY